MKERPGRRLPLRGVFRLGRFGDIWHKHALSAVIALAIPDLILLAVGRLDLAVYTSAGAMCALYGHGLPYAARARGLIWVALGMIGGVGVALVASGLTRSTTILIIVSAMLAALHKVVCDATRIGPPGNLIFTFMAATCAFIPQRLTEVPFHLALAALGAILAALVCMAPALVRPEGPQRIVVARALEAVARLPHAASTGGTPTPRVRHDAAAAVNAAWRTLLPVPASPNRGALERLLVHAEETLATGFTTEAARLTGWATDLRRNRPLPRTSRTEDEAAELTGIAMERAVRSREPSVLRAFHPASALFPIGVRVAVGSALAGLTSMALGVGHPYWAVVMAASVFQANAMLSWQRALQRALGSVFGLLVFALLLPISRTGQLALVLLVLFLQFCTEALITRNYWLGTVCVTPMALLLTEFSGYQPAGQLIADRWLDTCVGVAAGLLGCLLVTNRRTAGRIDAALHRVAVTRAGAGHLLASGSAGPGDISRARGLLAAALVELREAAEVAAGEWWQRVLPAERIAHAEQEGHRTLTRLRGPVRDRVASKSING
ncbi:FUSC family protein [Streptosporangium sp. NPDC049248]|uniref:FUSC family protein n=1 Tax=Streptosporangium sp. NPDC049248 TaxID=3155651 RepID=UPI00342E983E